MVDVLWIHGWGTSPRAWGDAPHLLSDKTNRFFSYAGLDTIDQMRRGVAMALQQLKPGDFVVAWSLGAMLALEAVFSREYAFSGLMVAAGTLRFVDRDRSRGWPDRVLARMQAQLGTAQEQTLARFAESMITEDELARCGGLPVTLGQTDFTPAGLYAGLIYLRETDLRPEWRRWRAAGKAIVERFEASDVNGCQAQHHRLRNAERFEDSDVDSDHEQHHRLRNADRLQRSDVNCDPVQGRRPRLLWLHGDCDPICPAGAVPADLSEEERCLIGGVGHAPFLTAPGAFAHNIEKFILQP